MIRTFFLYLLSFAPGSAWIATGSWRKGLTVFALFMVAALIYRASGLLGANFLFAGFFVLAITYASILVASFRRIRKYSSGARVVLALMSCFCIKVLARVALYYLAAGNVVIVPSEALAPAYPANSMVYATRFIGQPKLGEILIHRYNDVLIAGIVCGLPGQKIQMNGVTVFQDDQPTNCDTPVFSPAGERNTVPIVVQEDSFFLISNSGAVDSGQIGAVPRKDLDTKILYQINDSTLGSLFKSVMMFLHKLV